MAIKSITVQNFLHIVIIVQTVIFPYRNTATVKLKNSQQKIPAKYCQIYKLLFIKTLSDVINKKERNDV